MVVQVTMVCRTAEVLGNGYRMVEIDDINDFGLKTNRYKVKYWNKSLQSRFMSFPINTLVILVGRLDNDENGETIIIAEKVQFLDDTGKKIKQL